MFTKAQLFSQIGFAMEFMCDFLITSSISYYLWKAKLASQSQRTVNLLSRLITISVEIGLLCTVTSCSSLVLFETSPHTSLYTIPLFMLGKMYSNSLLTVRSSFFFLVPYPFGSQHRYKGAQLSYSDHGQPPDLRPHSHERVGLPRSYQ